MRSIFECLNGRRYCGYGEKTVGAWYAAVTVVELRKYHHSILAIFGVGEFNGDM
jgi:hypothetical protein